MAVITISMEPGAHGEELAARIAGHLGFVLLDDAYLADLWREADLDAMKPESAEEAVPWERNGTDPEAEESFGGLPGFMVQMAEEHDLVIIGRGAQGLFRNRPGVLHVRLVAPRPFRVKQMQVLEGLSAKEARRRIRDLEARTFRRLRLRHGLNWTDPCLYDITLRMDRLSIDQALSLIEAAVEETNVRHVSRKRIVENLLAGSAEAEAKGDARFVNSAEKEFADFLEFYCIPYEYEPRTFPLKTDPEGKVIEAFTPDFYLPEQDLYIELTTMKQSLVTRKNRKLRELRRLYPEVNIRLFYRRDFLQLMAKYGILEGGTGAKDPVAGNECRPRSGV
jgi:cytidylate kinase